MKDEEVEKLVEECLQGKSTGVRKMDAIISLRNGTKIAAWWGDKADKWGEIKNV